MKKKLTAKTVEALTATGPRRLEVWDLALPGFGIRVSAGGHKSWFCTKRCNGRPARLTLGSYPRLSLSEARDAARERMTAADQPWKTQQPRETLGEVVPRFIELYAKPKNRNWRQSESLLRQKFSELFDVQVRDIRRGDVVRILEAMVASGTPGRANHAMAAIKKLFNWCLDRGCLDINPIAGLSAPGKKTARERVLTDAEITRLLKVAENEG